MTALVKVLEVEDSGKVVNDELHVLRVSVGEEGEDSEEAVVEVSPSLQPHSVLEQRTYAGNRDASSKGLRKI